MGNCFSVETDAEVEHLKSVNKSLRLNHGKQLAVWQAAYKSWYDRSQDLSRELELLKEKISKSPDDTFHLVIDGQNVGWKAIDICYWKKINEETNRRIDAELLIESDEVTAGKKNKKKRKAKKQKKRKDRAVVLAQVRKEIPRKFDLKIFEKGIISCIHGIKDKFPNLKITLVLYTMNQTQKISQLQDDQLCVNFYVKNETDDLSILGLAKNIGKNAFVLSNDKFKNWIQDYPGVYDEVIENNVIGGFNFKKVEEDTKDGEYNDFSCHELQKRLKKAKRAA